MELIGLFFIAGELVSENPYEEMWCVAVSGMMLFLVVTVSFIIDSTHSGENCFQGFIKLLHMVAPDC